MLCTLANIGWWLLEYHFLKSVKQILWYFGGLPKTLNFLSFKPTFPLQKIRLSFQIPVSQNWLKIVYICLFEICCMVLWLQNMRIIKACTNANDTAKSDFKKLLPSLAGNLSHEVIKIQMYNDYRFLSYWSKSRQWKTWTAQWLRNNNDSHHPYINPTLIQRKCTLTWSISKHSLK